MLSMGSLSGLMPGMAETFGVSKQRMNRCAVLIMKSGCHSKTTEPPGSSHPAGSGVAIATTLSRRQPHVCPSVLVGTAAFNRPTKLYVDFAAFRCFCSIRRCRSDAALRLLCSWNWVSFLQKIFLCFIRL